MNNIQLLAALGHHFAALAKSADHPLYTQAANQNPWFTPYQLHFCIERWAEVLQEDKISQWLNAIEPASQPKNVGLILAGNIPLVGLHDLLSTLASGHIAYYKTSSDDQILIDYCVEFLKQTAPKRAFQLIKTEKLNQIDALIATGSNNSSRYFEHYFGHLPHIIRKNRNSAAILTGNETDEELKGLCEDIFTYYGLGCRSVSKLFVPENYRFDRLFEISENFREIMNSNRRYANNLDYNLALLLVNKTFHYTNQLLILKPDSALGSAVSVVNYEYYSDKKQLANSLQNQLDNIQCLVGQTFENLPMLAFGQTQYPQLADYADGVDTLNFLQQL